MRWIGPSILSVACWIFAPQDVRAGQSVTLQDAKGDVSVRAPKSKTYVRVTAGAAVEDRSRLRTGASSSVRLRFPDGSVADLREKSEIVVHAKKKGGGEPNGATLFFGRVWSKVAKAVGGETAFEVRSANAVAGVRGTEFEVGVADNGAARVIVREGRVDVAGDTGKTVPIKRGFEIESNHHGRLSRRVRAKKNPNWEGWFSKRAKQLERKGVEVATDLDGRVSRRWRQVEKLVRRQRELRQEIQRLERQGGSQGEMSSKLAELERVTERLESMRARLEAAFGMFERWGAKAARGELQGSDQIGRLAGNIDRIAAEFADMIEEGTDMSQEGMEEMMEDMREGGTLEDKKGGTKDLFR